MLIYIGPGKVAYRITINTPNAGKVQMAFGFTVEDWFGLGRSEWMRLVVFGMWLV